MIKDRFEELDKKYHIDSQSQVFGVYSDMENNQNNITDIHVLKHQIKTFSSGDLITRSLDFGRYARNLRQTRLTTKAGGTAATLESSYVDLSVSSLKGDKQNQSLAQLLTTWEHEDSRRQLAITGEYGQGKSTAMLNYCYEWADTFLRTGEISDRIPLLIELRGRNPAELSPISFLSPWCTRFGLQASGVMNLIKNGSAILIFEGFDELLKAGRAFDRHQHFNALWRFAYPGSKIVFTGRPNFFLDEREKNRTLRSGTLNGAASETYTDVWAIEMFSPLQIEKACRSYVASAREGILLAAKGNDNFYEIVSRPSMLPIVSTIWDKILDLRERGTDFTGALLVEKYLQAVYPTFRTFEIELFGIFTPSSYDGSALLWNEILLVQGRLLHTPPIVCFTHSQQTEDFELDRIDFVTKFIDQ